MGEEEEEKCLGTPLCETMKEGGGGLYIKHYSGYMRAYILLSERGLANLK